MKFHLLVSWREWQIQGHQSISLCGCCECDPSPSNYVYASLWMNDASLWGSCWLQGGPPNWTNLQDYAFKGVYYKLLLRSRIMKYHARLTRSFKRFFPRSLAIFYSSSHPLNVFCLAFKIQSNFILLGRPFNMTRWNQQESRNMTPSTTSHEAIGAAKGSQPEHTVCRCCQKANTSSWSYRLIASWG